MVNRIHTQLPNEGIRAAIRRLKFIAFDFDGVFTDNHVYILEDGQESVRCSRSDGIGLSRLRKLGLEIMIISTEVNQVVQARAAKLKLPSSPPSPASWRISPTA